MYTVYLHRNKITHKEYVGLTRQANLNKRWQNGRGYIKNVKFYQDIVKYGWDNFEHLILAENLTEEQASALEKQIIAERDLTHTGYNLDLGGSTTNHSLQTRQKIAMANKTRILGEKAHTNMSNGQKGNNNRGKAVRCIETNIVYPSAAAAARAIGLAGHSGIAACCRKAKDYKTAGGFHWEYA